MALDQAKEKDPEGMRKLPEEERISTLEELISTRTELNRILETLPISMHSQNAKNRKR